MRASKNTGLLLGALALGVILASSSFAGSGPNEKPGPGDPAPLFTVEDLDGKTVSLDALLKSGHVVLLNFWGLRCSSCIDEIGYLNPLIERYAGKGVTFLGINVDGVKADVVRQLMPKMANFPKYTVLPAPDFKIPDAYNLIGAPLSIIIGKDGKIAYRHEDFKPGDGERLEEALQKVLSGGS